MTTTTHGPWMFDHDSNERWMVFNPDEPDSAPVICREVRSIANARLIAAAPELRDSLVMLTTWMREHTGPRDGTLEMLSRATELLAHID